MVRVSKAGFSRRIDLRVNIEKRLAGQFTLAMGTIHMHLALIQRNCARRPRKRV